MTVAFYRASSADAKWFKANPAKRWRIRPGIEGAEPPPYEAIPGRKPAVAIFNTRHGIIAVPAPMPYPEEMENPWVGTNDSQLCRAKDYFLALQRSEGVVDTKLPIDVPDGLPEYNAALTQWPDRILKESFEPPKDTVPPELYGLFGKDDNEARAALLRAYLDQVINAEKTADGGFARATDTTPTGGMLSRTHFSIRFAADGRRIEKPSKELVDFLIEGDYPIKDDVPFVPPSGAYLIDVTDAPMRFAHFEDADTCFIHVSTIRAVRFGSEETEQAYWSWFTLFGRGLAPIALSSAFGHYALKEDREILRAFDEIVDTVVTLSEPACNVPQINYGILSTLGTLLTANAEMDGITTWSEAFEVMNKEESLMWRDVGRLIYGLAYLKQVRTLSGKPEPTAIPPNQKRGEVFSRYHYDNSIELPRYQLIRGQHPTAAEPKRDHLVEGMTERREHTRTQRYGKDLAESKIVTIKKNPRVKVWVRPDRDPEAPKRTRLRLNRAGIQALQTGVASDEEAK